MRRLRVCLANTRPGGVTSFRLVCGVTVRANYVALPFAAARDADEGSES